MPSETRTPMDLHLQADRTYEVLIRTLPGTRFGMGERWFALGPFASRLDATAEYEMLCRDFREDALVVLLLVAVVHDEGTGLYRDRILAARGRAPLIRRERMTLLSGQERRRLIMATLPQRHVARRAPAPPPPRAGGWTWVAAWGAATLATGLATGLAAWAFTTGLLG